MQTKSFTKATVASVLSLFLGAVGLAQNSNAQPHCKPISGTVMTNLGVVDQSTTLGVVEGDLKGAVAASILNVAPGAGGTVTFSVQHHFVTESGDNILVDPATATTKEVAPGLFAVLN